MGRLNGVCADEAARKLYVCDNDSNRVLVFKLLPECRRASRMGES